MDGGDKRLFTFLGGNYVILQLDCKPEPLSHHINKAIHIHKTVEL